LHEHHNLISHNLISVREQREYKHRTQKECSLLKFCYLHKSQTTQPSNPTQIPFIHNLSEPAIPQRTQSRFVQFVDALESKEQTERWFTTKKILTQNQATSHIVPSDSESVSAFALSSSHPEARPTLSIPIYLNTQPHELLTQALVDTGCNTSLVKSNLLARIYDAQGEPYTPMPLQTPTKLTAASGATISLTHMTELDLRVADSFIKHPFYIVDHIPIEQDIILGMDFLTIHQASIDIPSRQVALATPSPQLGLRCRLQRDVSLTPGQILRVALLTDPSVNPMSTVGYLHSVESLPDGCIMWHGVQECHNGQIIAHISNQSEQNIEFKEHTQLAWWQPDTHGEIASGDRLVAKAESRRPENLPPPISPQSSL
jgi:hypothetical protein